MPLTTVAALLGLPLGAGVSLYAVICWLAAFRQLGGVDLPGRLDLLTETPLLGGVVLLALVEFAVDKRRGLDTLWDAVHLFLRVPGGALLAFLAIEESTMWVRGVAALVGGGLAFAAHSTKASLRLTANALREPWTSVVLSLGEDVGVVVLVGLVVFEPVGALTAAGIASLGMAMYLPRVVGAFFVALNRTLNGLLARTR